MTPRLDSEPVLTDVYVTRTMRTPPGTPDPREFVAASCGCLRLHRVEWQETRRSTDGRRTVYRFRAPDAESVRLALRQAGIPYDSVSSRPPYPDPYPQ